MAIRREMIQKVILIDSNQTKSIKFKQLYACRSGVYCCIFSANVLQQLLENILNAHASLKCRLLHCAYYMHYLAIRREMTKKVMFD